MSEDLRRAMLDQLGRAVAADRERDAARDRHPSARGQVSR